MTAVRFLPIGIVAAIVPSIIQNIIHRVQAKKILVVSQIVMFIGTILLPFADTRDRYWPLMFIAFILGSSSAMAMYITSR
jgi:nitrate/nitrite transporter NarK